MRRIAGRLALAAMLLSLLGAELSPAEAQRRYRPVGTEISRAISRCRIAVIGGTLVGGVLGALVGGRRNRGGGAVLGAAGGNLAGGLVCAIMMRNAERQDAIIAAQMAAAARPPGGSYTAAIGGPAIAATRGAAPAADGDGKVEEEAPALQLAGLQLVSRVEDVTVQGTLVQVRYPSANGEVVSPLLSTDQRWCRRVSSRVVEGSDTAELPSQLYCRDIANNWAPYAVHGERVT